MYDITPESFISTLFPESLLAPGEAVCIGYPDSFIGRDGEVVEFYRHMAATGRALRRLPRQQEAWVYCVSTVALVPGEPVRRRKADVQRAFVLVVDDVGTKAKPLPVQPSYVLETSAGNFQWGYRLVPYGVSGGGAAKYDACLAGLADAGFNDPGCRGANRVMRLPGSLHRTGFRARVVEWHPDGAWHLDALMAALGVAPGRARGYGGRVQPGKYAVLEEVRDPLLDWLRERGALLGGHNDEWVHLECPWRALHTEGRQGSSSTSYSPLDYGRGGRQFKCQHGHCARTDMVDFLTWAHSLGYRDDNDTFETPT